MNLSIKPCELRSKALASLVAELDAEMNTLYPAESNHLDTIAELESRDAFVVGAFDGECMVGCGGFKPMSDDGIYGEIKRVFVKPAYRERGAASGILDALEHELLRRGISLARLETGAADPGALKLYEKAGYVRRGPFGNYQSDPLSLFFEKLLSSY
jgi:putative acetyltransferase